MIGVFMHPLALLTSPIITSDGTYVSKTISLADAKRLVQGVEIFSTIRHSATTEFLSALLGVKIPISSAILAQEIGQQALACPMNRRLEEGQVLTTEEEIRAIGLRFVLLTRTA